MTDSTPSYGDYHGHRVARHFGDPRSEYEAAVRTLAVFDRGHRARLQVSGRSPAEMLLGVVTGTIPALPDLSAEGISSGRATYQAVLTPKGRMITDLWLVRLGEDAGPGFLLDVPVAGRSGLLEHLTRFLPPRLARVEDVSDRLDAITLVGPEAAAALSKSALGLRVDHERLASSEEGAWVSAGRPGESPVVMRTAEVWPPAWTVYGPSSTIRSLRAAILAEGATAAGLGVWTTLRVEAGRPAYGTDMDDTTLLPEAGIVDRAVDATKGCYTGQEVIVRIRDRGHVNRSLLRLRLGEIPAPAPGTELLAADGSDKVVGTITSAVESPLEGGVLALAYVRRGVDRARIGGREITIDRD